MSFILDAIAKSEQERQLQEMPDARILAASVANEQKPRSYLRYLIIGVLLLNAVIVAIWMQSGQSVPVSNSPSQVINREQSNGESKVPVNALTTEEVRRIENTLSINRSSTGKQRISANENYDTIPTLVSKPEPGQLEPIEPMTNEITANSREMSTGIESRESLSRPFAAQRAATDAGQSSEPESVQLAPSVDETREDDTAWIHIGPDSLSNKTDSGQNIMPEQSTQNTAETYRKVSSLRELPDSVREGLPRVAFSGHLYSSNPRSSVVFMGAGHPVKQGQEIVDQLYLHKITPTGVVVEFRGYLIDVGVLQNWTLN